MTDDELVQRITLLLPDLAAERTYIDVAKRLYELAMEHYTSTPAELRPDDAEAENRSIYVRAMKTMDSTLVAELTPRWIDRYIQTLASRRVEESRRMEAFRERDEMLDLNMDLIITAVELKRFITSLGERMDPHMQKLIRAFDDAERFDGEDLAEVLSFAGPAITTARSVLFEWLGQHGIWHWPSGIVKALVRVAEYDSSVIDHLQSLLSSEDEELRKSAMSVLGAIGPAAKTSTAQLLAFTNASESEREHMLQALAKLGDTSPAVLDVIDAALADELPYVRYFAVRAIGELKAAPERFVPKLIRACDDDPPLYDGHSIPEEAVAALGHFGADAISALPRLEAFIAGPIAGRTVEEKLVRAAIEQINSKRATDIRVSERSNAPMRRDATSVRDDEPLFDVIYKGKVCYIDSRGQIVIETDGEYGAAFSDGRAIINPKDGPAKVIDRRGNVVFESGWRQIESFREGLAAIQADKKWGFVDVNGDVVVEPQYDSVTNFQEGLAGVELGRSSEVLSSSMSRTVFGKRGFIDRTGKVVIPIECLDAQPFHEGLAAVCTGGTTRSNSVLDGKEIFVHDKYGYIDRTGRLVIDGRYRLAHPFSEGLAVVATDERGFFGSQGYINLAGEMVIEPKLSSASRFSEGIAFIQRRGRKWRNRKFAINRQGNVVFESTYGHIGDFSAGRASVWENSAYGYIDQTGRMVIPAQFDECEPFRDGRARVKRGDWFGMIDTSGQFVWGPISEGFIGSRVMSDWR